MKKYALLFSLAAALVFIPVMAMAQAAATQVELQDGTKLSIEGDMVYVVAADGTKTSAPDDTYVTKDGKTIVTQDGKVVH